MSSCTILLSFHRKARNKQSWSKIMEQWDVWCDIQSGQELNIDFKIPRSWHPCIRRKGKPLFILWNQKWDTKNFHPPSSLFPSLLLFLSSLLSLLFFLFFFYHPFLLPSFLVYCSNLKIATWKERQKIKITCTKILVLE